MNIPSSYCKCIAVSMFNIQWIFYFSKCTLSYTYAWHLIVEATFHKKHSIEYTGNCNPFTSLRKCCTATVPETFYILTWMVSVRWANGERTLSERWAHAERNLVSAYEGWTVSEHRAQTDCKCECKVNGWTHRERYVNTIWMQDDQFIRSALLCFVGNQEKITKKNYIYVLLSA